MVNKPLKLKTMEILRTKEENFHQIAEAIEAALPEGEVVSWLAQVRTREGHFATMGESRLSGQTKVIANFMFKEGPID